MFLELNNNYLYRDFTRPDLPAGDQETVSLPDLSAYGIIVSVYVCMYLSVHMSI